MTEEQLNNVLKKAAQQLNLKKYTSKIDLNSHRGDGFLGELFKASIFDEETKTNFHLILKKAPHIQRYREQNSVEYAYKNEILFYSEVYPIFRNFESEHGISNLFDSVPEYVTSCEEIGKEIIVLQDLTSEGFELRGRSLLLDEEHAREIFQIYGRFHAISFCLKEEKPEVYEKLERRCFNIFGKFLEKSGFCLALTNTARQSFEALDQEEHAELRKKFQKYVDRTVEIFSESMVYSGKFSGILHGDCWSNNMMFKYEGSKLKNVKLLDFQVLKTGTPIYDLSHFFYSGGSKEQFDKLEQYLDIYYESFSHWVKNLGCDPEKLLPRDVLSEEWKIYSKYGMLLSIVLVKVKLSNRNDSIHLTDPDLKDMFGKRVRDILVHMDEINAL